ncbi:MAG: DUF2950 domain-containing protein [Candidatus Acidiferrum sp.]
MRLIKLHFHNFDSNFSKVAILAILLAAPLSIAARAPQHSQPQPQHGQKTFPSAEAASNALFTATQQNDEKQLLEILGRDAKQLISSGDESEDAENRAHFVQKYQELHRLVKEPDGTTTLYIGAMNWPTPIPLVNKGDSWFFDTDAAEHEILFRRIGGNEMSTIRVCQELVSAEKEYRSTHPDQYAPKVFSDPGQQNGLYWEPVSGQPKSPVGPLVARAVTDAASPQSDAAPYRGYYYRILTRQGKNAPGGAKNYVESGKLISGFAFLAYPAEYRSSGVMTFIVAEDGVVYQKDLGKKTASLVKTMKEYNPDSSWEKFEESPEETASQQSAK